MKPLPFKVRMETSMEKWRAETFWDKEPETLAWIKSFKAGDTFLDIGANIGLYSLYAAKRKCPTLAVEPHPGNFQALALNYRQLNRHLPLRPLFGGVGAKNELKDFYFDTVEAGSTGGAHSTTHKGQQRQHVRVFTVDYLMEWYGPFKHIKIDVDGEEVQIVRGMKQSLEKRAFKSCLIEVGPESKSYIFEWLLIAGYAQDNEFNRMTPHSRERRAEEGIDVENIIFTRLD